MKYRITALFLILLLAPALKAQSVNFRFSNYFYGWQRIDSLSTLSTAKTTHIRGYQNLLLDFSQGQWSFNALAQTEEDAVNKVGKGFNYRFYNLYVKGSNLFNLLDVKIGRQYIFGGVGKGTVDGLYFKVKAGKDKEYQLALYGGALAPDTYEFVKYPSIKNNFMAGAQFTYYGVKDLMASVSYMNKHEQLESYSANRLDSLFNTTTRTILFSSDALQLAGIDFNYLYNSKHSIYGKVYYDINQRKFYRGEVDISISAAKNLRVFAGYLYREPQINYNSIFWVFEHSKTQQIEGGADYALKNGINIYAKVSGILYNNDHSLRFEAGFTHPNFGLSVSRYMGYAGESDGVSGYYNRQFVDSKITATSSISYSRYRIGDYTTEKLNSFSGVLGLTYRPVPQFSVDAQGQFIINRIYKIDSRFLIGFNYWFFKKL